MIKNISKITVLSLFAATLVALPTLSRAEGAGANPPAASDQTPPAKSKKHEGLVFRGTVSAIDAQAMTLRVETRTFAITANTKIAKDGKPATLGDGTVGEPVSGAYTKADDGTLTATTVHFGAKPEKKKTEPAGPGGDK
jgi:hypothetical protein